MKKIARFEFCFLWVTCHKRGRFRPFWPRLLGPAAHLQDGSISLKFLLTLKLKSESFEPLIDFLMFLVQKIWP